MSDEHNRETGGLVPFEGGEAVSRATALVRRGLNLLETQKPTEDATITQLRERANAGEADAQLQLGYAYVTGQGVPQDYTQGVQWYRKAAEQGLPEAQQKLGDEASASNGDWEQATYWYRKAAEQGNAEAQSSLGFACRYGLDVPQDDAEAIHWWRKAAEQNYGGAQYWLGVAYQDGKGVPQDDAEAVQWFRKAAEQGHLTAHYSLGVACFVGRGVPQDEAQAIQWFRKAAEEGQADAQYRLGYAYSTGRGVSQDYVEAYKWIDLAVRCSISIGGQERWLGERETVAVQMSLAEIGEAQRRAKEWIEAFERRKPQELLRRDGLRSNAASS